MMRSGVLIGAAVAVIGLVAVLVAPVTVEASSSPPNPRPRAARSPEAVPPPGRPLSLLFIHHSVGFQLLSDPGANGQPGQHENGGGLRRLLESNGYSVHTATYGSPLGEKTDLFDWPEKLSSELGAVLTTADGTQPLPNGRKHDVVLFKSCFPNSAFQAHGTAPGKPRGPELTLENARAMMNGLLPEFRKHPDTLFVYLTAPPLAGGYREPLWKWAAKAALGRGGTEHMAHQASLAREFNDWVSAEDGWLRDHTLRNVAVIDYYDILTDHGASNFLRYPSGDGFDSHPSSTGQKKAAPEVLAALNRAVHRWTSARAETPAAEPPRTVTAGNP